MPRELAETRQQGWRLGQDAYARVLTRLEHQEAQRWGSWCMEPEERHALEDAWAPSLQALEEAARPRPCVVPRHLRCFSRPPQPQQD